MLGGDLRLNLGASSDLLAVTGAATFTSASTVTPTFSAPPALGPVTLLTTSALTLTTAPSLALPANTRSTFALTNTATALQLSITGAAAQTLAWSGTASGVWDINTTFNFNAGAEKFFTFDGVTFGDGPANRTVTLAAGLTPSNVAVNNSAGNDYTFQTGTLNGSMALTKAGSGALNLNTANAFDGAVTVTGGTLKAGNAAALGSINGQTFVSGGGTLDVGVRISGPSGSTSPARAWAETARSSTPARRRCWPRASSR